MQVKRLKLPPTTNRFRWVSETGEYLGEMDFFAVSQEAAKLIIADLAQVLGGAQLTTKVDPVIARKLKIA